MELNNYQILAVMAFTAVAFLCVTIVLHYLLERHDEKYREREVEKKKRSVKTAPVFVPWNER